VEKARRGVTNLARVLVVDDQTHVREMLRDFLAGLGHEVTKSASSAEALEAVKGPVASQHAS